MAKLKVNVSKVIEQIGFGRFQILTFLAISVRSFSFGSKEGMLAIVEPYLRCHWNLDFLRATMIVLPEALVRIAASPLIGRFSDKYGRRSMMLLLFTMHSLMSLLNLSSPSLLTLALTRAAIGFQSCGQIIVYTYLIEVFPISGRKYIPTTMFMYALGSIYAIVAAMLCLEYLNWRWYIAFTEAIPLAISALVVFWLPESPSYLNVSGRENDAMFALERIAKINGKERGYQIIAERDKVGEKLGSENGSDKKDKYLSRYEIIKRIGLQSLLLFIGGVVAQSIRFGTMQVAENSEIVQCGNCTQHLTFKYRWPMEFGLILSVIVTSNCIEKLKRASSYKLIFGSLILAWIFLYFNFRGWYLILLTFLISFLEAVYNALSNIYQAEALPSSVRSTGSGINGAVSQCGGLLGRFFSLYVYHINSSISYGLVHCMLIAGLIATFTIFVETKGEKLQDF